MYKGQAISQGVSLNHPQNYQECLSIYSRYGGGEGVYDVLIGLDDETPINPSVIDHPVSRGGVGLDRIRVIYVPRRRLFEVREMFESIPSVSTKVRAFP